VRFLGFRGAHGWLKPAYVCVSEEFTVRRNVLHLLKKHPTGAFFGLPRQKCRYTKEELGVKNGE
jgi:hypothetical protein